MLRSLRKLSCQPRGVALLLLTMSCVGCGQFLQGDPQSREREPSVPSDLPQVVATAGVLCDLTQQVAQQAIDLTCLIDPGQDPHTYEPTPSDRRAIETADLIFYGGYDLEPGLVQLIEATNNVAPKIPVYEAAVPNPLLAKGHEHNHAPEAATTARLTPDPHVWHDAESGIKITEIIRGKLEQIAPEQAQVYQRHATSLITTLEQLDVWIQTQVATIPASNRTLITTHDAFRYFAQAYGFAVGGAFSGLSTEEEPSAAQMTELVNQVKAAGVPAIFAESTTNRKLIEAIARDAGVTVAEQALLVEGPGGPGTTAETYQQMLVFNTCAIVNALDGQCTAEDAPISAR